MRTVAHLWVLDCPVHKQATVQRQTFTQIYTTIMTIMAAAIKTVGVTPTSPLIEKWVTKWEMSDKTGYKSLLGCVWEPNGSLMGA
jgi:hypothetical protein